MNLRITFTAAYQTLAETGEEERRGKWRGRERAWKLSLLGRREILGRYSSSPIRETAGVVCSRKILDGLTWPYVAGGYELTGYGLIYFRVPDFPGIRVYRHPSYMRFLQFYDSIISISQIIFFESLYLWDTFVYRHGYCCKIWRLIFKLRKWMLMGLNNSLKWED